MTMVLPRKSRALSATAECVGHVIRQSTVERVRPRLRTLRTVHVAWAAVPAFAPLISWRGVGLADPPAWPEPPVAPFAGGVVPPGFVPSPVAGPMPVPFSAILVAPGAVLSARVSVALRGPPACGVKTTPMWQDSPAATVACEHVSVPAAIAKSSVWPAGVTSPTASGASPVFRDGGVHDVARRPDRPAAERAHGARRADRAVALDRGQARVRKSPLIAADDHRAAVVQRHERVGPAGRSS